VREDYCENDFFCQLGGQSDQFEAGRCSRTAEQIDHARTLIEKGENRQYVADLLNASRVTLYRAIR
jgi:hypothetical protein